MPTEKGISKAVRVWLGVGTSVFIGAAGAGCSEPAGNAADRPPAAQGDVARTDGGNATASPQAVSTGGEGEGEGEGEGASTASPVDDDVEYLHRLGQTRGHLVAFIELHRMGMQDMSMTHAKHPESELYQGLVPAFAARGKPGFAEELAALASAVERGTNVDIAYRNVVRAISENEPPADFATRLMAIATLARTAGMEFAIGVADDGTVVNAHEYQDAFGFLTAAGEMLADHRPANAEEEQAVLLAKRQLAIALEEFGSLTANHVDGRASAIHGAAARIEIEANMLH